MANEYESFYTREQHVCGMERRLGVRTDERLPKMIETRVSYIIESV